jgi:hypothetical protein
MPEVMMPEVIMPVVIMVIVIIPSVIMQSFVLLSVVMPSMVMPIVLAQLSLHNNELLDRSRVQICARIVQFGGKKGKNSVLKSNNRATVFEQSHFFKFET